MAATFEEYVYKGQTVDKVILGHSYRKYIRIDPAKKTAVNGAGDESTNAQWKLHAVSHNAFKLQNLVSSKFLQIINNGNTVDVAGSVQDVRFTTFKIHNNNNNDPNAPTPPSNNIKLESLEYKGCYLAVNDQKKVYSFSTKNPNNNSDPNDMNLWLYACSSNDVGIDLKEKEGVVELHEGVVTIEHELNAYLRIKPGNETEINSQGGDDDKFTQWRLEFFKNNKKLIKFKNIKSGKYLRIVNNGTTVNVGGGGGGYTLFKYSFIDKSLESNIFPGVFLAINKQNNKIVAIKKNQFKPGDKKKYGIKFNIDYLDIKLNEGSFNRDGFVTIQHELNKLLQAKPGNELQIDTNGVSGSAATQWKLKLIDKDLNLVSFRNCKNQKYLRIWSSVDVNGGGGPYTKFKYDINAHAHTLEAVKTKSFLAINKNNNTMIGINKNELNNPTYGSTFIIDYIPDIIEDFVFIEHGFGKSLRVNPNNNLLICGNGDTGTDIAKWYLEYCDTAKTKVKFRSQKTDKYLRIINNGIIVNVGGGGGPFTIFKYDKINKTLESNKFPGFYLAVQSPQNTVISTKHPSNNISLQFNIALSSQN